MISIQLNDQAKDVMQYIEVAPARVGKAFNDRHCGYIIPGNPMRIGVVHWFKDQTVFCIGTVSKSHREGERLYFKEVIAELVLDLTGNLPSGTVEQGMEFNQILGIVANSFGLPIITAEGCPPNVIHYRAPWDGQMHVQVAKDDTVLIQGSFNPQTHECSYVWAFSLNKYLKWYGDKDVEERGQP